MMKPARRRHEAVSVPAALRRVRLCRRAKTRLRARFARTAPGRWHGRPLRCSVPPRLSFVRSFCFTRRAAARMISFSHSTPSLSLFCRSFRPVSASVVPAEAMGANGMPLRLMAWMPALPRRTRPPVIPPSPATLAHPPAMPPTPRTRRPPGFRHPATPARPPRRLRRPATAARPPHHFRRPQPPPSRPPCLHRPHSPPATGGFCVRANAPKGRRDKRRRRGAPATPSPSPYNPRPSAAPPLA